MYDTWTLARNYNAHRDDLICNSANWKSENLGVLPLFNFSGILLLSVFIAGTSGFPGIWEFAQSVSCISRTRAHVENFAKCMSDLNFVLKFLRRIQREKLARDNARLRYVARGERRGFSYIIIFNQCSSFGKQRMHVMPDVCFNVLHRYEELQV